MKLSALLLAPLLCASVAQAQIASGAAGGAGSQGQRGAALVDWAWPLPGVDAQDWVVQHYVDLDPGPGVLDYAGGTKTYDGHPGIDIHVPTFRAMDADVPVLAVETGTVVGADDAHFDRNTSCSDPWNFVTVLHPSGLRTTYGHLKQDSLLVAVGQVVQKGQPLAVVGSSGCSDQPHLHLETRSLTNGVVDPMAEGLFARPPVYDTPLGLMDVVLTAGPLTDLHQIVDPLPNATLLLYGETLGVGLSLAGGAAGDVVEVGLRAPDGELQLVEAHVLAESHGHWYLDWNLAPEARLGTWTVEVSTNGVLMASHPVQLEPDLVQAKIERFGMRHEEYAAEKAFFNDAGYYTTWFDGYEVGGQTFVNAVFTPGAWSVYSFHELTVEEFDYYAWEASVSFLSPVHVDCYPLDGELRYALLAVQAPSSHWLLVRSDSRAEHEAELQSIAGYLSSFGLRSAYLSVQPNGADVVIVEVFRDDVPVNMDVRLELDPAQFQYEMVEQAQAGRTLIHLDTYNGPDGLPRISAIWADSGFTVWSAGDDLTLGELQAADLWENLAGRELQLVSGYEGLDGLARFVAFWSV